jgi:sec-independent protein translocase protein TatA
MGPSHWQLLIVLIIILLIFGPKKLPQLARSIGKSVGELKKGLSGINEDIQDAGQADSQTGPAHSSPDVGESEARPVEHNANTQNTENK